jgi:hypothetical protein
MLIPIMKWNEAEFIHYVGHEPIEDDLERCNCEKAGEIGHFDCGICEHNKPVFECSQCFRKKHGEIRRK